MTPTRRTQFLILLLIVSAVAAAGAFASLNSARQDALSSQSDRAISLGEMSAMKASSAGSDASDSNADVAINRRLRGAAVAAHLADQLASIDAGTPAAVRNSDFLQTPIYLRLNSVSLKQLVGFLYELSITDNSLRTSDIELSLPVTGLANRSDPGDLWTADVTLSFLSFQQRQPSDVR